MQFRYFVELKKNLADKEEKPIHVYVKDYNRGHVCDMFDEYYVLTVDRTD